MGGWHLLFVFVLQAAIGVSFQANLLGRILNDTIKWGGGFRFLSLSFKPRLV